MGIDVDIVYKFFADYIYKHSGILYKPDDYYRLESRMQQMMQKLDLSTLDELYLTYSKEVSLDLHRMIIDTATNNETYFIRDKKPFDLLAKTLIPEIMKNNPPTIKIWSAASSTGQEPYSILMSIDNECGPSAFDKVSMNATDISEAALEKARSGKYTPLEVQRGLPITMLMKYFEQNEDNSWTIDSRLKSKVNYSSFNLFDGAYPIMAYDIIFCRNVLIYQDMTNKELILNKICDSMKEDAYLFFGAGESLIGLNTPLEPKTINDVTVYVKKK
jgi:chemotaxis protein methyltransferase CheR